MVWLRVTVAMVAGLAPAACDGEPGRPVNPSASTMHGPGFYQLTITSGNEEREYLLDVPDGYRRDQPIPLVVVLHAGDSDADTIRTSSRMERLAQEQDVLVA